MAGIIGNGIGSYLLRTPDSDVFKTCDDGLRAVDLNRLIAYQHVYCQMSNAQSFRQCSKDRRPSPLSRLSGDRELQYLWCEQNIKVRTTLTSRRRFALELT